MQAPYIDPLAIARLRNMEVKARTIVEGFMAGLHRSPFHGFSVEFAEHRAYNLGESLRNVDWKVYGKTDRLYSKRYEEETNLRCQVVLDISDSMRYPREGMSKLEYGCYLTGALQYMMIGQRDAAGLVLFDNQIRKQLPARSSRSHLVQLLVSLEQVVAEKDRFTHTSAMTGVFHELAVSFPRRSLIVILTDLLSQADTRTDFVKALQHFRHRRHEVVVFHVMDISTEVNLEFPNRPLVMQDLETGEKIQITPHEYREQYRALMTSWQQEMKRTCQGLGVDFMEIDIRKPFDQALMAYLVRRRMITG